MKIKSHIVTKKQYTPPIIQFERIEEEGELLHGTGDATTPPIPGEGGNSRMAKRNNFFDEFFFDDNVEEVTTDEIFYDEI